MNKRLYRSVSNRMLSGVCGGIGEYFDIDPTPRAPGLGYIHLRYHRRRSGCLCDCRNYHTG